MLALVYKKMSEGDVINAGKVTHVYKGAARGTYWHKLDASVMGFKMNARHPAGVDAVVRHINGGSSTSRYLSVTTSLNVATMYAKAAALDGIATSPSFPAYIYEIDISRIGPESMLVDPIKVTSSGFPAGSWAHHHDGDANFLGSLLPYFPPVNGGATPLALASDEFKAITFSLRDAEILIEGDVPSLAVTRREVW